MSIIKQLKDAQGNNIVPIASTSATYNSEGKSVDALIEEINDRFDIVGDDIEYAVARELNHTVQTTKQVLQEDQKIQVRENIGFGDGKLDTTPTENSNRLVNSGNIYKAINNIKVNSKLEQNITISSEDNKPYYKLDRGYVPMLHPDISTQPSLLSQKFGTLDMYEIASRVEIDSVVSIENIDSPNLTTYLKIDLTSIPVEYVYSTIPVEDLTYLDVLEIAKHPIYPEWIMRHLSDTPTIDNDLFERIKIIYDNDLHVNCLIKNVAGRWHYLDTTVGNQLWVSGSQYGNMYYLSSDNLKRNYDFTDILYMGNLFLIQPIAGKGLGALGKIDPERVKFRLKDIPNKSVILSANAFNNTNQSSVSTLKSNRKLLAININFIPDFVLCKYYLNGKDDYYYSSNAGGGQNKSSIIRIDEHTVMCDRYTFVDMGTGDGVYWCTEELHDENGNILWFTWGNPEGSTDNSDAGNWNNPSTFKLNKKYRIPKPSEFTLLVGQSHYSTGGDLIVYMAIANSCLLYFTYPLIQNKNKAYLWSADRGNEPIALSIAERSITGVDSIIKCPIRPVLDVPKNI